MNLDGNEYFVVEAVDRLSRSKRAPLAGWCTTPKKNIADFICLSERTVERIIRKIVDRGIAIKHPDNKKYPGALQVVPEFRELVEQYRNMSEGDWDELAALGKVFETDRQIDGGGTDRLTEGVPTDCRGETDRLSGSNHSNNSKGYNNNKNNGLFCFEKIFDGKKVVYDFDLLFEHYGKGDGEQKALDWYRSNVRDERTYMDLWKAFRNYKQSKQVENGYQKDFINFVSNKYWKRDWSY